MGAAVPLSVLPVLASARAGAGGSALPPRPKMAAGIRRRFGLAYGPHGQRNLLDLYLPAAGPGGSTRSVFSSITCARLALAPNYSSRTNNG